MALNNLTVNSVSVVSSEKGQKESSGEAGSNGVDVSSQALPLKVKLTSKKMSKTVVERLPNGWSKKTLKRLRGIAKGGIISERFSIWLQSSKK